MAMVGAMTVARGSHHSLNSKFLKEVMEKIHHYHRESSSSKLMSVIARSEEENSCDVEDRDKMCWVPHGRTGIYYPKGHEKVMEDIPSEAAKNMEVHRFSYREDLNDHHDLSTE